MTKLVKSALAISISLSLSLSGCGKFKDSTSDNSRNNTQNAASGQVRVETPSTSKPVENAPVPVQQIDFSTVKPNESGKIIVAMFHNFVESFTPTQYDKGEYTTTFDEFRKLLPVLYEKGYRLINLNDYLNNNISVPAGCIPMIFTFDDGTSGQFNLLEESGTLTVNKQSAVGILEEFNKSHPDFGLKGTFYVNLGLETFKGKGTVSQRLKYLIDKGFEIGNHTLTHIHLNEAKSANEVQQEIGGNQKKMYELVPDYKMKSFALPFGQASKNLQGFVAKGEFEGVKYDNLAIMEVGWIPTLSPVSKKFNPFSTHRVRASGIKPVDMDLGWWMTKLSKNEQYVSDGDPNTVTVPKSKETEVDTSKLNGKKLNVY